MKIKRFNEELHNVEEGSEQYTWIGESIEDLFFQNLDLASSELMSNGEKGISLVFEFFCCDLNSELLIQLAKYCEFINKYGDYEFYTLEPAKGAKEHFLIIEANFSFTKQEQLEKELLDKVGMKFHPDSKKYNL